MILLHCGTKKCPGLVGSRLLGGGGKAGSSLAHSPLSGLPFSTHHQATWAQEGLRAMLDSLFLKQK